MTRIGMAWMYKDGAVYEFSADKVREETLGMIYVPVYVVDALLNQRQSTMAEDIAKQIENGAPGDSQSNR